MRGIVAWQTERELSLALTKGDQNEWLAKLLRQRAEKVERDSDRPLGPRENTTRSPPSLRMNACPRGSFRRQFARRQTASWRAQCHSGFRRCNQLPPAGRAIRRTHHRQSGDSGVASRHGESCAALSDPLRSDLYMVLALTRLAAAGLEESHHGSLRPLLALHFILLTSVLAICVSAGFGLDPASPIAVFAGMVGVAAMAVQNALVQISLVGAPATAVMTTDVTAIVMDVGAMLFQRDPDVLARAGSRARHTWPAVVGFAVGCGLGAVLDAAIGPWSLALPTGFALLALGLSSRV